MVSILKFLLKMFLLWLLCLNITLTLLLLFLCFITDYSLHPPTQPTPKLPVNSSCSPLSSNSKASKLSAEISQILFPPWPCSQVPATFSNAWWPPSLMSHQYFKFNMLRTEHTICLTCKVSSPPIFAYGDVHCHPHESGLKSLSSLTFTHHPLTHSHILWNPILIPIPNALPSSSHHY